MRGSIIRHYTKTGVAKAAPGQCPNCLSRRVLGPRIIKDDGVKWCHCYKCKHEWKIGAVGRRKGYKPKRAYGRKDQLPKPKLKWDW